MQNTNRKTDCQHNSNRKNRQNDETKQSTKHKPFGMK